MSEDFYIEDPDGLTIEIYADRDRHLWPWRGNELDAVVLPLDFAQLLTTPNTRWKSVVPKS